MPCTATTSPPRAPELRKRVVNCNARAHKRPRFLRRQFIGNRRQRRRRRDHVFGITAIEIDPGDLAIDAHREIAAPALFADEINVRHASPRRRAGLFSMA